MIDLKVNNSAIKQFLDALDRFEAVVKRESETLPLQHAHDYYSAIIHSIVSNRFASTFPTYNPEYLEWKKRVSSSSSYWKLFGDLQNNIIVSQKRKRFFSVRIRSGATTKSRLLPRLYGKGTYQSKPESIEKIGQILEYGAGKIPARPLWKLTRDSYWKNGYVRRVENTRNSMKASWY